MSLPHRRIYPVNDSCGNYLPQRPATMTGGMAPPPLPPRRRAALGPAGSLYGSPFGGGFMSPYGGDMYGSSYGMYPYRSTFASRYGGYGYGGYGAEDPYSPFQSVESLVRAISSLSMMVESTYQSMYTSFRAVLGVADNMDQLRRVVFDVFGSLTLVKTIVWFFKKVLYILGLLKNNPVREKAWEAAAAEVVGGAPAAASTGRTWPLVAFFGLMLGGPYVLYKLASPAANAAWDPKTEGGIKCVAMHDFETDQRGELPFRRGELIVRQNQVQGGWALATKKGGQVGYVPADRLKPISKIGGGAQQNPLSPRPNPVTGYPPYGSPYSSPYYPHGPAAGSVAADMDDVEDLFGSQPASMAVGPSQQSSTGTMQPGLSPRVVPTPVTSTPQVAPAPQVPPSPAATANVPVPSIDSATPVGSVAPTDPTVGNATETQG